ncbi:transporter substrate-binding domain-containing protein, partial [Pseudomonas sp. CrR25]|nr:transporter substrate-binding domain-containing protein [Pseudomonas sp. CrR25]
MAATRWRALAVGLLLLGGGAKGEAEKILLETVEEAPYQVYLQGALSGQAVTQLDCIFQHLEFAPVYRVTSPARAHLNLRKARVDGYFSAAPNPDIDRFADLSVPLLVKKWNSYSYAPELLNLPIWDQRLKIGVISGGNTMAWLDSRGVAPAMQAVSLEQLLELLHKGRVNLIVADEMALQEVLEDHPALPRPLQRFQQFTPLGVYFAKAFLRDNPGFLAEFDRRAESCRAPNPELNPQQLSALRSLIDGH